MSTFFKVILVIVSACFIVFHWVPVYAKDVCFIGDSFTEGLELYSDIDADFYGYRGITTGGILKKDIINKDLKNKDYKQIYVLLGINEVCNNDSETFIKNYIKIIDQICTLQPNAKITLQYIFHTTNKKSNTSNFKNIYIDEYNYCLWYLSMHRSDIYILDFNYLYDNGNGTAMFSNYSKDGVHLKQQYYDKWYNKLKEYLYYE